MSVYFAQRKTNGLIKIGWSRSVKVRMSAVRAKVIGAVPGEREVELSLHKRFAHLRVRGEWFKPDDELLVYIQSEAQGHEPDSESVQTAIRTPKSWLDRLDKIAERLSQPGMRVTRTEALRLATYRGIVELEAEGKKR